MISPYLKTLFWHAAIALVVMAVFGVIGDGNGWGGAATFFVLTIPLRMRHTPFRVWAFVGRQLVLACIFFLCFAFFVYGLLAQNETAVFLALLVLVSLDRWRSSYWALIRRSPGWFLLTVLGGWVVVVGVVFVTMYVNPILFADEWRHANAYFYNLDLIQSLIKRKNGHLMVFPNGILQVNYHVFRGTEYMLGLVNAALLAFTGHIVAHTLCKGRYVPVLKRGAIELMLSGFLFWMVGYSSILWGLGLHNHLAVLGAVLCAYFAAGFTGKLDDRQTVLKIFASAYLAAASFSAGASAWFLGIASAIATKQKLKITLLYAFVGGIGFMMTLGFFVLRRPPQGGIDLKEAISAILALIGYPVVTAVQARANMTPIDVFSWSKFFGAVGILVFIVLTLVILSAKQPTHKIQIEERSRRIFVWLLMVFGLGACVLIIAGRLGSSPEVMNILTPRYVPWAVIFWLGVLAICINALLGHRVQTSRFDPTGLTVFCVLFGLLITNIWVINSVIQYGHTYKLRRAMDVILTAPSEKLAGTVYHKDKEQLVLRVAQYLKANHLNIYAQDWPYLVGRTFPDQEVPIGRKCAGWFGARDYGDGTAMIVDGWAWPDNQQGLLETIVFV
ncbi:MAG TPA: hypothetical protein ENJ46_02365, partial [Hellea balneolensis]|nr:hypothetical protein [Hellea balneolensis]